ncbi:MAG TPA: hypothetical protein VHB25_08530 [Gemmatimonadaceae bacterium]|nr:hypothetical protein [Gemmatimonadaceae bacterium]
MNLSTLSIDTMLDALSATLNNGYLKVYGHASGGASTDGAPPADADTALGTQTLLVTHRFAAGAFGAAALRQIVANAIASVAVAATGTARFIRLLKADGATVVADLTLGACTMTVAAPGAAKGAVVVPVNALAAPVYQGDRFLVGGNKVLTVGADANAGAVSVTVAALADAIAAGETATYDMVWNSAQLQLNADNAISALTISLPKGL